MKSPLTESPFTVLVDTREQLPYAFGGIVADANEGGLPLKVRTRRETLWAGDYSIEGYARMVCVERKSKEDLAGTLTAGRKRFQDEMDRLREYDAAWIVVEAELSELWRPIPWAPKFSPKTILRSWMFFSLRYPKVHWCAVPGRAVAENLTYQLLRSWWRERIEGPRKAAARREAEAWRLAATQQHPGGAAGGAARRRGK